MPFEQYCVEVLLSAEQITVNVPLQATVSPLQFPEPTDTDILLYVPIAGLFQVGAPVQVRPLLTAVPLQVTAGAVIGIPNAPVEGTATQVGTAAATANVPLQVAVLPLQFPEPTDTDILLYVPIAGLFQVGAPVQVRPLLTAVPLQVTVGEVIAVPAVPVEGTAAQVGTADATVNVPLQVAVLPLQFPELAATDTLLYVPAAGLLQVGAPVQVRPLVTAVPLQVTAGEVIAVPAVPVEGTAAQVSTEATVNVPLQVADFPLHSPELADTDTPLYVPAAGLLQVGAPVQVRPLVTAVPLQVTAGDVIAVPNVPVEGTVAQVNTEATVNVPQVAVLLLPPQFAVADTLYVFAAGLLQFGAFTQANKPLATVAVPHLTVG